MEDSKERKIAFFVDDDADFLHLLAQAIQHPHYEVRTFCAQNGYQTIDEVIKLKPDLLFIDFYLPRARANQIVPVLRSVEALARIPIYFVSGYSKSEILPFLDEVQCDGVLLKGSHLREEVLKILDALDRAVSV